MRQEVTRAHKGWALDSVTLHNEVIKAVKEDISAPPAVCLSNILFWIKENFSPNFNFSSYIPCYHCNGYYFLCNFFLPERHYNIKGENIHYSHFKKKGVGITIMIKKKFKKI